MTISYIKEGDSNVGYGVKPIAYIDFKGYKNKIC